MQTTTITVRIDSDIKRQFDSLCEELGISTNAAFNIFARTVVRERAIPFQLKVDSKKDALERGRKAFERMRQYAADNNYPDLTLNEVNEVIYGIRKDK